MDIDRSREADLGWRVRKVEGGRSGDSDIEMGVRGREVIAVELQGLCSRGQLS